MNFSSLLADEIARKRQQIEKTTTNTKKRYVTKGAIEKLREEEYLKEQQIIEEKRKAKKELASIEHKKDVESDPLITKSDNKLTEEEESKLSNLSDEEIVRRLRLKGQPIRLFDESNRQRQVRLRALELVEERSSGQRNDFKLKLQEVDTDAQLDLLKKSNISQEDSKVKTKSAYDSIDTTVLTSEMINSDPDKVYLLVYVFFKRTLRAWEADLANRSEEVKLSSEGKKNLAIFHQSSDYLKPFFKLVKRKALDKEVLNFITEIVLQLQVKEYVKANDAYLRLSIGNAPWPIGVTMVGIHERSGREKIHSNQIAHVLNDETQRKWIQSIKRLMTFLQRVNPPDDISKCVG